MKLYMAKSILFLFLVSCVTALSEDVGRFQLIVIEYADVSGVKKPTLFKIDTTTGKTWRLGTVAIPAKLPEHLGLKQLIVEGWTPIADDLSAATEEQKKILKQLSDPRGAPQPPKSVPNN